MEIHHLLSDFRKSGNMAFYVDYFLQHPKEIKKLVAIIVNEETYPFPEYGSWILIHIHKANKSFVEPYVNQLIDRVLTGNNQSVLRNCCSILQTTEKTGYKESELLDRFIDFIESGDNKVALQVYSIYCLIDYIKKYPELKSELTALVQMKATERSSAYGVAVRKFLIEIKNV